MILDVAGPESRDPYVDFSRTWKKGDKANKVDFKTWSAMAPLQSKWSEVVPGENSRMALMKHMGWSMKLPVGVMDD